MLSTASGGRWRFSILGGNKWRFWPRFKYMLWQDGKAWFCRWYCGFCYTIDQSPDLGPTRKRRLLQRALTRALYGERPACCEVVFEILLHCTCTVCTGGNCADILLLSPLWKYDCMTSGAVSDGDLRSKTPNGYLIAKVHCTKFGERARMRTTRNIIRERNFVKK